jgi:heme-degrading monooxygenase HmoA
MVLEVGEIAIVPGREDDFVAAYRGVRDVLAGTPGCRSVRMTRGIESPTRFVLLVEWDDVAAHEENFRGTDRRTSSTSRTSTDHSAATASMRLPAGSATIAMNSPRR